MIIKLESRHVDLLKQNTYSNEMYLNQIKVQGHHKKLEINIKLTQITRNIMYLNFYILKFLNFKIFFYCLNDFENCNFYIKQTF